MKHQLNLLENAIDSLNEAMRKYAEGQGGEHGAFKFAILHFAHFQELLFKYYVTQSHPLLIYRNPFSKNIANENTIGLWEAIQFLRNEGKSIDTQFNKDLEWLKALRNDIEHYKFEMDVRQVRRTMGRLVRATAEFGTSISLPDFQVENLVARLGATERKSYEILLDEYRANLANARAEAKAVSVDGMAHECPACFEGRTAAREGDSLVCKFCGKTTGVVTCGRCNGIVPEEQTTVPVDRNGKVEGYVCIFCMGEATWY